jgi:outer membrane protein
MIHNAHLTVLAVLLAATCPLCLGGEDAADAATTLPRSLNLDTARALALRHNRSIAQAKERIREQDGVVVEARSAFSPRVDANGGYDFRDQNRIESFGGLFAPIDQSWIADVAVTYTVLDGKFRDANSEAAKAAKAAAESQMQAVLDEVLLQVSLRYFDALLATDRIDVQQKALDVLGEQLSYATKRFDAGAGKQFDVLQAEVALANAKPGLVRAQGAYKIAIDQLRRTIGLDFPKGAGPKDIKLADRWPDAKLRHSLDDAIRRALDNRPELAAVRAQIEANRQQVIAEQSRHKPKLQVVGSYGAQSLSFTDTTADAMAGWTAGLRLSIPIIDGGLTKGKVQQAESRLRQAELGEEQRQFDIEGEVRDAFVSWEESSTIMESSRLVVEQADEALRLARSSFEAGALTQLDVLQSQLELTRARLEEVVALHNYHTSLASLRRAMGDIAESQP